MDITQANTSQVDMTESDQTASELLTATLSPDEFRDIVNEHTPKLNAYLRSRVPGEHDREDLIQQTFMKFAGSNFDPSKAPGPYLNTIANRLVVDQYRKGSRSIHTITFNESPAEDDNSLALAEIALSNETDPALAVEIEETRSIGKRIVSNALNALPELQRSCIKAIEFENLTHSEAAETLDLEKTTFKNRLQWARHLLKRNVLSDPDIDHLGISA